MLIITIKIFQCKDGQLLLPPPHLASDSLIVQLLWQIENLDGSAFSLCASSFCFKQLFDSYKNLSQPIYAFTHINAYEFISLCL